MIFNSPEFFIFITLAFLIYWFACGRSLKLQNAFLVVASYVFYAWWDWRFAGLLAGVSFAAYFIGLGIRKYSGNHSRAKSLSALNVIISVLILFIFKYYNFFAGSFADIFLSGQADKLLIDLVLPVGISFFLFKSMSYTIDVYMGRIEPERNIINLFAYIGFFPQLLAGPIARPGDLLPQIAQKRVFTYEQGVDGCRQFLWGLFKKIVVADNCAVYVDEVFSSYQTQTGSTLLLAAILYSIQIYADFSGYSDMAIGTGKLFGFSSRKNFDFPYFSRNIAEFWRRWHISLTTWFRDYIYIPLGGSRVPRWRVILNTLAVFLVSGLWHGANWTFIAWGLYHGILLSIGILFGWNRKYKEPVASGKVLPSLKELGMMAGTFVLAMFGWIIFRAENIHIFWEFLDCLFSTSIISVPLLRNRYYYIPLFFVICCCIAVEWLNREGQFYNNHCNQKSWIKRLLYIFCIISIYLCIIFQDQGNPEFIYSQF